MLCFSFSPGRSHLHHGIRQGWTVGAHGLRRNEVSAVEAMEVEVAGDLPKVHRFEPTWKSPDAPCMVYLPTFGWFLGHMLVNIPYMEYLDH